MCRKVYYDLIQLENWWGQKSIAIARMEQLYPFPEKEYVAELKRYPGFKGSHLVPRGAHESRSLVFHATST